MLSIIQRPKNLSDFVGQRHLVGEGAPIKQMIERKNFIHSFFYGPPGCGKTTLCRIIAHSCDYDFLEFNATSLKIDSLRKKLALYEGALMKPLIFIDEVHRLNRAQQEVLLPIMENFEALILGASTYNPYFALTNAIRSRSMLFECKALDSREMDEILSHACKKLNIEPSSDARQYLIHTSNGDARAMLNLLDIARDNPTLSNLKLIRSTPLNEGVSEDGTHYDLISALIKSIRGSDANASIYYLARLINANENPEFIARRLVILSSEDIGNANPNALNLASSTMQSVAKIGYPESRIILAQCVLYLAASPKCNTSYKAINSAQKFAREQNPPCVPKNIAQQNEGYKYPHDFGGWVEQDYLPREVGEKFVEWSDIGFERTLKDWLSKITQKKEDS